MSARHAVRSDAQPQSGRRWRVGVYTVCTPHLSPAEVVEQVAHSPVLAGVEWRVTDEPWSGPPDEPVSFLGRNAATLTACEDAADEAARLAGAAGVATIAWNPYLRVGDLDGVERHASLAARAGAGGLRLRAAEYMSGEPVDQVLRDSRRFVARAGEICARHGVRVLVEMHQRTVCASASAARRLVDGLPPEQVGVIYDIGNTVIEGYEDPRVATAALGPHLAHVHLKNAAWERTSAGAWRSRWVPLDEGQVDAPAFLDHLDNIGYAGWVSLEDLSTHRPPAQTLRHNEALLTAWLTHNTVTPPDAQRSDTPGRST